jgi:hypothetical protein
MMNKNNILRPNAFCLNSGEINLVNKTSHRTYHDLQEDNPELETQDEHL